jgi:hypothetical protein
MAANMSTLNKPLCWWTLILLALLGYSLPVIITSGVSLSMGAYDAAEWTSLHPAVRGGSPLLVTSLLLRLPLVCTAFVVGLSSRKPRRWLHMLSVTLIALALLPPLEFLTQAGDDPNYRQQFALAVAAMASGLLATNPRVQQWRFSLSVVGAFLGAGAYGVGMAQVNQLVSEFRIPVQLGWGSLVFAAAFLMLGISQRPTDQQQTR